MSDPERDEIDPDEEDVRPGIDDEPNEAGEEGGEYDGGGYDGGYGGDAGDSSDSSDGGDDPDFLPSEHPLMARVQAALNRQLKSQDERLTLQYREKEAEVLAIKTKREQIGVDLYSFQQGLAKLQMQLEKCHDKYNEEFTIREENEQKLKQKTDVYKRKVEEREALQAKRVKATKELDKLKITVKQIDDFNEKVKSEILVTRRAAYGTEQNMQKLEKNKRHQDELVDNLNEQLRQAGDQLKIHEGQLKSQQAETEKARATLEEAAQEMELIAAEKREYLQKWKSSLIGMANRDTALQAVETALTEHREKLFNLDMEIKGYRTSAKQEQNKNEKLTAQLNRVEAEIKFVDNQLAQCQDKRKALNDKYVMLRSTLERTDAALQSHNQEQREIKSDIQTLHKQYEKLVQDKQKVDDTIMENLSNQTTIEKGAQGVWKVTQKLRATIHEKEIKMGEIQNEVARIKVDSLNTGAHNKELAQTLQAYDKELKEKDKLIEKYELEIRQRHDKIEKKQIYIARLNRKYEQLMSKQQDENTGPLEATIKNLNKEITDKNKQSAQLQREWIKSQTELVALVSQTNQEQEKVQELKARQTILSQKKLRLNSSFGAHQQEIKELQKMIKAMHTDMSKLNELISKNATMQTELANQTYVMESEFMNKLKELELKSVKTDANVARLKDAKEAIFQEIVEVEKQIMLWEKKIVLERETQEALDPEYGQPEIKGMQKEIHRMKLRLSQLKRQQEKMIQEMERTIEKREHIKLGTMASKSKKQQHYTQATLNKKISSLKETLKSNVAESKRVMQEITKQEEHNNNLLGDLEQQQSIYGGVEDRRNELAARADEAHFGKQMNLERLLMCRKRAQKYEDAISNKLKITPEEAMRLEDDLMRSDDKHQKLTDAIGKLMADNPKHAAFFKRLLSLG